MNAYIPGGAGAGAALPCLWFPQAPPWCERSCMFYY